jgi:hypothetical protein
MFCPWDPKGRTFHKTKKYFKGEKVALLISRATLVAKVFQNISINGKKVVHMDNFLTFQNFFIHFKTFHLLKNYFNRKLFTSQRNIFRFGKYFQKKIYINISSYIFGTRPSWRSDTICYSRWSIWKLRPRNVCSRFRFEPTRFYCVVSLKFLFVISSPGLG